MGSSILRTAIACTLWALGHSLPASTASKQWASRVLGQRHTEGLYRLGYNGFAVITTCALAMYLHRLPDRELYRIRGPWRVPVKLLRWALLLVALRAALEIGLGPFTGFSEAGRWLTGKPTFPVPEGQGPAAAQSPVAGQGPAAGQGTERHKLKTGGPFRHVRHPLNASASALFFLPLRMSGVRLTVALLTLAYAVYGSKREERRLLAMYGEAYAKYIASGVPFFVPRWPVRQALFS